MIQLYKFNNNNFKENGDIVLQPISAFLEMELYTGINQIELEIPIDKEGRWKFVEKDDVISVPSPYPIEDQLYRIYDRNINSSSNSMSIKARHIFYDLIDTQVKDMSNDNIFDVRCANMNGQQALDKILANTGFTGYSNILEANTAYYFRKNVIEALANGDNSFFKRWGGELFLNNFNVYVNYKVGEDLKTRISYSRNLEGFEEETNWENIVTRIIPTGFDGICLDGKTPWVDSPLIKNYSHVYENTIYYEDIKVKGTQNNSGEDATGFDTIEEAREELIKRAKQEFTKGIDKPLVNYKINLLSLDNLNEFKNYKKLTQTLLGDTVNVLDKRFNLNIITRVIKIKFNILLDNKVEELELGNPIVNFAQDQAQTSISVENMAGNLNSNGTLKGSCIEGVINAMKAPILAQKDIAKKLDSVAWKMEILDPNDPNFGCILGGTEGILISNRRTPDGRDWDFTTAVTAKGIVADTIVSGVLSTILIQNADGSFQIDLSGSGGAKYFTDGKIAMAMEGNSLLFYNWLKDGDYIGELGSYCRADDKFPNGNPDKPVITLANDLDSALTIAYKKANGDTSSYIDFDKYNILGNNIPIYLREDAGLGNNSLFFGEGKECELYCSVDKDLVANCKHGFIVRDKDSGKSIAVLGSDYTAFGKWNSSEFYAYFQPDSFTLPNLFKNKGDSTIVAEKFHSNGDITCSGKKNRVVETENFGKVLQNAYETAECYFGDIQETVIPTTGELTVIMDKKFLETVNTEVPYQVFTTKYGQGDLYVAERNKDNFIIKGTPSLNFCYEVKAKQKGYEKDRLENFKEITSISPSL